MLRSRHPTQTQQLPGAVCDLEKQLTVGKAKGKKNQQNQQLAKGENQFRCYLGVQEPHGFRSCVGLSAWDAGTACRAITLIPVAVRISGTPPTPAQALGDDTVLCLCLCGVLSSVERQLHLMNRQLMIKVQCFELDHSGWYLQTSAGYGTTVFRLHTEEGCEKVGKKQFWGAEFCSLHFPFSVLGQAAESRLSCLKIQKLTYLPLCRAGFHPWEQCLRRHCRSQSRAGQKKTLCERVRFSM